MHKTQIATLSELEQRSPKGKYHIFRKSISEALGGKKDTGTWGGGHPFDIELSRVPPKATNFPYHAHSAQWEMYIFISGTGSVRGPLDTLTVSAGDCVLFPPEEAHSIINSGDEDLLFYVIADHAPADVVIYPDTGKWGIKPQRKCFRMTEVDYFEEGD